MQSKLLLFIPPFTQLNTAYPSTSYLKGFLEDHGVQVDHCDLSIELFTSIFTSDFLQTIFAEAELLGNKSFPKVKKMKSLYCSRVDEVVGFLQKNDLETAKKLIEPNYFPKGHRLQNVNSAIKWDEGDNGIIDKAKHYSTLFIEEIGDYIQANVDNFFAFTKYAEQIAKSASNFDQIEEFLNYQPTVIEFELLTVAISLPV